MPAYRALEVVLLRLPGLPVACCPALLEADAADEATLRLLADPFVQRALSFASPSLLRALGLARETGQPDRGALMRLRNYLVRMTTRPTPFGLFAGVALARWSDRTDLSLTDEYAIRTRLDMGVLLRLVQSLETDSLLCREVRWTLHEGVWVKGATVWVDGQDITLDHYAAPAAGLSLADAVKALQVHTGTPASREALVAALQRACPALSAEEADQCLVRLHAAKVLRSDLHPPVTCQWPLTWLRAQLAGYPAGQRWLPQLDSLHAALQACDRLQPVAALEAQGVAEALARNVCAAPASPLLQVDMAVGLQGAGLNQAVADEAARLAELLVRLSPEPRGPAPVQAYRRAFIERYGTDRWVPLLELVNPEWGLGPVPIPGPGIHAVEDTLRLARRDETLQTLALTALRERRQVVELNPALLARLDLGAGAVRCPPRSMDLNLLVLAASCEALDAGAFQVVLGPNVGAGAAGRTLARFADLLGDPARVALDVAASVARTTAPDVITAELACLADPPRMANVTVRPPVQAWEVCEGVSPGVAANRAIPLHELAVGVHNDRFHVRWLPAGKEVVITTGHMLSPLASPPACQVLALISQDGQAVLNGFDWGPARDWPFLPRVQAGRCILSPARWRLSAGALGHEGAGPTAAAFAEALGVWRERWQVPRHLYWCEGDNRLLLDLDAPDTHEMLRKVLRRRSDLSFCRLEEALPGPEDAWLSGRQGSHLVEVVVSLAQRDEPVMDRAASFATQMPSGQAAALAGWEERLALPGGDWLYLKLYGPSRGQDRLLAGPLREIGEQAVREGLIEHWHFLRYADPSAHLRVRFRGAPDVLMGHLLPRLCALCADLINQGACSRFVFDTYERELERYGGREGMEVVERLFGADSQTVVQLIHACPDHDRTLLAAISIDDLLASLGLDAHARLNWLSRVMPVHKGIGEEFRAKRSALLSALAEDRASNILGSILRARREAIDPVGRELTGLVRAGALAQDHEALLRSIVHLHCNRLCADDTSEWRAHALLLRAWRALIKQA